jgi:hypothetical protein
MQHHENGCPILAFPARVGYGAARGVVILTGTLRLSFPTSNQKQNGPPEGSPFVLTDS